MNLLLVIPVSDRARHSALGPERAGVLDVKGLPGLKGEVEPLEQLSHHHFSFHL